MSDPKKPDPTDGTEGQSETISSEDLAALIVDALLRAGVVQPADATRAVAIAAEEIEVRKTLGDY